ncbi:MULTISPECIES: EF-P 5-aminopentanol modification-associated protein YfmF [Paenibacillus]|uniref:EF-P 5-aminopentanol modification-associated protein YfmF n=1 Tax=Paenibacillus TaxID=44249 RepID=UPI00203D4D62|nr:pitrilysin family protein [Paenibacillus camelliae]MCM3631973.1 insulinase family protein [Paenibacillus camelliae]
MEFQVGKVKNITIHVLPTNRFKTYAITLFAGTPLEEQTVTSTALIPYVLRRGTARFPETIQLREQLDNMYGAGFGFNIVKRGNTQFIQLRMDVINDRFVNSEHSLLNGALQYLGDVLTNPLIEQGGFREAYVDAEKGTLKKQLDSIINDKIHYAAERCIQEMCEHEPYRLNASGKLEDLPHIDANSLFQRYSDWLSEAQFDLYVVGDTTLEEVTKLVEQNFQMPASAKPIQYKPAEASHSVSSVKTVVDRMEVSQGKLNLGLRMNVGYADPDYVCALVYNGILGTYPHSKLFVNVREKESLAYYCSSRYDAHKGIVTIQSGIEFENYEKALGIIEKQLDDMKAGHISDVELEQTKAMLTNAMREILDNANDIAGFDFNKQYANVDRSVESVIEQISKVSKDDVQRIANQVALDTIYFLRDRQEV